MEYALYMSRWQTTLDLHINKGKTSKSCDHDTPNGVGLYTKLSKYPLKFPDKVQYQYNNGT